VLNAFAVYNALLIDEKLYKIKARMFGLVSWVYGHPKFEMLSDDVKGIREWKGESEVIAKKILWKEEIEKTWNDCDKMIEQKVQEYEDYLQKKGLLQTYRRNGIHIGVRAKENYKLMVRESTNNDPQELFRVIKSTIMNKVSDRSK
jgi:hypothetical protein